eukprot:30986-Pelagococcus_subviridis.AAC.16
MGGERRRQKSLRIGVHLANAVVWGPVYRTHLHGDARELSREKRRHRAAAQPDENHPRRARPGPVEQTVRAVHPQHDRGDARHAPQVQVAQHVVVRVAVGFAEGGAVAVLERERQPLLDLVETQRPPRPVGDDPHDAVELALFFEQHDRVGHVLEVAVLRAFVPVHVRVPLVPDPPRGVPPRRRGLVFVLRRRRRGRVFGVGVGGLVVAAGGRRRARRDEAIAARRGRAGEARANARAIPREIRRRPSLGPRGTRGRGGGRANSRERRLRRGHRVRRARVGSCDDTTPREGSAVGCERSCGGIATLERARFPSRRPLLGGRVGRTAARRRGGRPPVQSLATRPARERTTRHHRQMIRSDDSPAPPTLSRPAPSLCPPVNLQNYVMMYYLNSPRRATATKRAEGWLRPNDSVVVSRRVSK